MAIQLKRGSYDQFDPTALLPGEMAVVTSGDPNTTSGHALYVCLATGDVQRIPTAAEVAALIAANNGN